MKNTARPVKNALSDSEQRQGSGNVGCLGQGAMVLLLSVMRIGYMRIFALASSAALILSVIILM